MLIKASWCIALAINAERATAFAPSFGLVQQQSTSRLFSTIATDTANDAVEAEDEPVAQKQTSTSTRLPALFPSLAGALDTLGFSTPTPIQLASATRALELENLLLIAPTGSGKTLAYLLPSLQKAVLAGDSTVLIVAPTRELAAQLMRDTTAILSNLKDVDDVSESVLLAVKGVDVPTTEQLNAATVMIGTPPELVQVLTSVQGGNEFVAGDVLSSVILDEVDVLLPNAPKRLRTALDSAGNDKKNGNKKKNMTPAQMQSDDRRKQEQKRKLKAAKRTGIEISATNKQIVAPTDTLLKLIASRYSAGGAAARPYQIIAGSATASRRTLDRLNKALYDAAIHASSTVEVVFSGSVQPCRPDVVDVVSSSGEEVQAREVNNDTDGAPSSVAVTAEQQQHTIRAVTVPQQVKHQYIALDKESASSPGAVLAAVAKAAGILKPQTALVFLCGDFGKFSAKAKAKPAPVAGKPGKLHQARRKQATLANKKLAAAAASRAKNTPIGLSARQACSTLGTFGIEAKPLHVALGLELNAKDDDEDADIPPFLVTFEGSARGLHFDNVDTVFVVGRPASAASYLHLAGRVGRSSTSDDGGVVIRPGTVVSLCTKGSAIELNKWTKQVGGSALSELILPVL
jgi:superfamily II DNA/RNA helicase